MTSAKLCNKRRCSRPINHAGKCGVIKPSELKIMVPGSNGSAADRALWHGINARR